MARITIEDLPVLEELTVEETQSIFGGSSGCGDENGNGENGNGYSGDNANDNGNAGGASVFGAWFDISLK